MRFVKSCKNQFRIFLYVCILIGLQLDFIKELLQHASLIEQFKIIKNSLAYEIKTNFQAVIIADVSIFSSASLG